jgi:hypothetical protein
MNKLHVDKRFYEAGGRTNRHYVEAYDVRNSSSSKLYVQWISEDGGSIQEWTLMWWFGRLAKALEVENEQTACR